MENEVVNNEVVEEVSFQYCVSVRFIGSKKAYNFGTNDETLQYGDKVVVETVRGMELGEMVSDLRDAASHDLKMQLKPIIRKATRTDVMQSERNKEDSAWAMAQCQKCIEELKLEMYLISAEYTLDRSKVIFTYVADDRVDFRELLKSLASILHCRIELRQIGPRDKAKIVGGLGMCGMECCCSRFKEEFDIVSINMAKNQLLALNTAKLSGQCGKLMCCLKYEDDDYKVLRAGLPKLNSAIMYNGNRYRITAINLLNNTAHLSSKEENFDITVDELRELNAKKIANAENSNS